MACHAVPSRATPCHPRTAGTVGTPQRSGGRSSTATAAARTSSATPCTAREALGPLARAEPGHRPGRRRLRQRCARLTAGGPFHHLSHLMIGGDAGRQSTDLTVTDNWLYGGLISINRGTSNNQHTTGLHLGSFLRNKVRPEPGRPGVRRRRLRHHTGVQVAVGPARPSRRAHLRRPGRRLLRGHHAALLRIITG
jgi:hypothetical protein